jgi:DivIVA domain-containing protein
MSQTMMWVFAVLVVLAMGGVALVAAGRGEPMAPTYDDRPDALVPDGRPLAAEDLRRVRFSLALRGYRMSEVDALLSRLAAELEAHDTPAEGTGPEAPSEPRTDPPSPGGRHRGPTAGEGS